MGAVSSPFTCTCNKNTNAGFTVPLKLTFGFDWCLFIRPYSCRRSRSLWVAVQVPETHVRHMSGTLVSPTTHPVHGSSGLLSPYACWTLPRMEKPGSRYLSRGEARVFGVGESSLDWPEYPGSVLTPVVPASPPLGAGLFTVPASPRSHAYQCEF
jgi:hypothetical protein